MVPPKDPKALAEAILSIISNQSLQHELGREAVKTAKNYDVNVIGSKYAQVYKKALSNA